MAFRPLHSCPPLPSFLCFFFFFFITSFSSHSARLNVSVRFRSVRSFQLPFNSIVINSAGNFYCFRMAGGIQLIGQPIASSDLIGLLESNRTEWRCSEFKTIQLPIRSKLIMFSERNGHYQKCSIYFNTSPISSHNHPSAGASTSERPSALPCALTFPACPGVGPLLPLDFPRCLDVGPPLPLGFPPVPGCSPSAAPRLSRGDWALAFPCAGIFRGCLGVRPPLRVDFPGRPGLGLNACLPLRLGAGLRVP